MPKTVKSTLLHFSVFEVDLSSRELRKRGRLVKLENLPFQVLEVLVEHPGELVTREELFSRLWPSGTHVEFEDGLNTAVRKLRSALNDSAESPVFIETHARRGYRFIAPLSSAPRNDRDPTAEITKIDSPGQTDARPASLLSAAPQVTFIGPGKTKTLYFYMALLAVMAALCIFAYKASRVVQFVRATRRELPNPEAIEIRKLTDNEDVDSAAISPDGRLVVYSRQDGEKWSLRIKQVQAGGDAQILAPSANALVALAFSPDGEHIYFGRADDAKPGYHRLYVMPALGGPAQLVMNDVDAPPGFSPDGRQFVFMRGKPKENLIELRIANSDGSGEHLLAAIPESSSEVQHGATWSPDGTTIAVGIKHQGSKFNSVLYAIKPEDGSVKPIYASDGTIGRPLWLPEGHDLVVSIANGTAGRGQLLFVSYPTGDLTRITNDLSDYDLTLDLTRDGKKAVAVGKTIRSKLWTYTNGPLTDTNGVEDLAEPLLEGVESGGRNIMIRGLKDVWLVNGKKNSPVLFLKQTVDNITTCDNFAVVNTIQDGTRQLLRYDEAEPAPNLWCRII